MKAEFIRSWNISLTPLSPIHIGCGEDYEPTNYVISDHCLYAFNPSVVPLNDSLRREFREAVRSGSIPSIAAFFQRHVNEFKIFAEKIVPICRSCEEKHHNMVTKGEARNQNRIGRTAYYSTNEGVEYLIPGSAVKGVIHTALLNKVNKKQPRRKSDNLDRDILGVNPSSFSNSPMRFVKISDFQCKTPIPAKIVEARRCYKNDGNGVTRKGVVPGAFEVLERGLYRPFTGKLSLQTEHHKINSYHTYSQIEEVFRDLNNYFAPILTEELKKFSQISGGRTWSQKLSLLIRILSDDWLNSHAAIIRIGKNVGAESLVLQGNFACIHGRGGKTSSKTEWRISDQQEILPFGWCILELSDSPVRSAIASFCEEQNKTEIVDFSEILNLRKEKEKEIKRQQEEALAQQLKAEEKARVEELRRAELPPEKLLLEDLVKKAKTFVGDIKPGTTLYNEILSILEQALSWAIDLQIEAARDIGMIAKTKNMYQGKKAKELKALLRTLRQEG